MNLTRRSFFGRVLAVFVAAPVAAKVLPEVVSVDIETLWRPSFSQYIYLYGGGAGGGKTDLMLRKAWLHASGYGMGGKTFNNMIGLRRTD